MNPRPTHLRSRARDRSPAAVSRVLGTLDEKASPWQPASGVRADSRHLTARGFRQAEAGNLTAYLLGLAPVEGGWTVEEIERLLFVRHLAATGRIRS